MNTRTINRVLVLALALALVAVSIQGCKKSEPEQPASPNVQTQAQQLGSQAEQGLAKLAEQTTCPVMGGPVNKAIFVEYQGKKVYFCCKGCEDKFNAEPEKYVAKLPQLQK